MTLLALLGSLAFGGTLEDIEQRLAEVAPLRAGRMVKSAPPIPAELWARVAEGKVVTNVVPVEGHASKKAYGIAVLDTPIERLWAAVNDDSSRVEYTQLSYAELLEGETCKSGRKVLQFLPLPVVADRWWIANMRTNVGLQRASKGRIRELAWKGSFDLHDLKTTTAREQVENGVPIEFTEGSWFLIDLDGSRTILEYYAWSDPGGSLPKGLVSSMAAKNVGDLIKSMEQLAQLGSRCPIE